MNRREVVVGAVVASAAAALPAIPALAAPARVCPVVLTTLERFSGDFILRKIDSWVEAMRISALYWPGDLYVSCDTAAILAISGQLENPTVPDLERLGGRYVGAFHDKRVFIDFAFAPTRWVSRELHDYQLQWQFRPTPSPGERAGGSPTA